MQIPYHFNIVIRFAGACLIVLLFVGRVYAQDVEQEGPDYSQWGRLAVLSIYNMTAIHGEDTSVRGPLSRQAFVTDKVAADADVFMNRMVERHLAKRRGLSWQPMPVQSSEVVLTPSTTKAAHLNQITELGQLDKADVVLAGYLYAFRQREGGDYGVQAPAKVVFELILVHSGTGRLVWQQRFKETQKALSDNLLDFGKFIKRKGRWIRAHEMAEAALQEMLDDMFQTTTCNVPVTDR